MAFFYRKTPFYQKSHFVRFLYRPPPKIAGFSVIFASENHRDGANFKAVVSVAARNSRTFKKLAPSRWYGLAPLGLDFYASHRNPHHRDGASFLKVANFAANFARRDSRISAGVWETFEF